MTVISNLFKKIIPVILLSFFYLKISSGAKLQENQKFINDTKEKTNLNPQQLNIRPEVINIKLDLNSVTEEQLINANLYRVGPKLAKEIITYRSSIVKFTSIDQLNNVKGIGPKIYEKIKDKFFITY